MNKIRFAALTAACGLALTAGAAVAATDSTTTTFSVTITINESCEFSGAAADDVDFGDVDRSTAATATGNLYVTCTDGTPYTIALDNGSHASGSAITEYSRQMALGTVYVPYGLYTDSGYSELWGDGTNGSVAESEGTGDQQTFPVYAAVTAASTDVAAGTYTDTVTATIAY
ncbi:MAG: spore coat U domain-containing protein [Pseudoxanthomonas sp.]